MQESAAPFEDVPLSPPPEPAEEDTDWEKIDEGRDATEEFEVINHFGNPAFGHRDAHLDTPSVRP